MYFEIDNWWPYNDRHLTLFVGGGGGGARKIILHFQWNLKALKLIIRDISLMLFSFWQIQWFLNIFKWPLIFVTLNVEQDFSLSWRLPRGISHSRSFQLFNPKMIILFSYQPNMTFWPHPWPQILSCMKKEKTIVEYQNPCFFKANKMKTSYYFWSRTDQWPLHDPNFTLNSESWIRKERISCLISKWTFLGEKIQKWRHFLNVSYASWNSALKKY